MPAEPAEIVPATLVPPDSPCAGTASGAKVLSFAGDYRMVRRLGVGSYGEVWMAEGPGGTEVAIKIITRPLSHKEAQQELHALENVKRLRHPYLVQTQAFWVLNDQLHIAIELADGSLSDRVRQCRDQGLPGIPVEELLGYFREAAEAVDYLHSRQVHHRDIKPANILILGGHAKLADFGLARLLQSQVSVTEATFCGTPSYMPPEVWHGKVSQHSDQWSLAATYAELRLNAPVFKGASLPALMLEICQGHLDLSSLPEAEQQVLRKALATEPHDRYGTCKEFVQALEEALFPPSPETEFESGSQGGGATRTRMRNRLLATSAVAVLACLLTGIVSRFLNPHGVVPGLPRITLVDPPALRVATGRQASFPLRIHRQDFEGKVGITFEGSDLPGHVTIVPQEISPGKQEAGVQVNVAQEAAPGTHKIRLRTEGSPAAEAILELTIVYLPRDFETDGEVVPDGKNIPYYKRISSTLEGMRIRFVLIPQKSNRERKSRKVDPDTFYMMQDKVSLGLFRKFATLFPEHVRSTKWKEGTDDQHPVLGVTVDEAHQFASRWLKGRLPSTEQWDKAAGRYEPAAGEGPYRGRWWDNPKPEIAVKHPAAVGSATSDVSVFECRDMAGNGYEWTRTLMAGKGEVPIANPRLAEHVVYLRGHGFGAEEPLRFDDLDDTKRPPFSMPYKMTRPDIGFRVVIEP